MAGPCVSYDGDGIRSFCEMLDAVCPAPSTPKRLM
jgi:hypothetical protein